MKRPEPDRCDSPAARAITASVYAQRRAEILAEGRTLELCPQCHAWRVMCECGIGGEG